MPHELMALAFTVYAVLQVWTLIVWRGGWRLAALAPLILCAAVLVQTVIAYQQRSNLWPIALIFFFPLGSAYLALVAAARAIVKGSDTVARKY